jgi:hypothetical protein
MMKSVFICCSAILACSVIACGTAKVEVTVVPQMKAAVDKVTPASKFVYYVVKGAEPKTASDLKTRTLFVCCDFSVDDVLPIVVDASLNVPRFDSVQTYAVASNMSNPINKSDDTCAFKNSSMYYGSGVPFTSKELIFCKTATEAQIQQRTIKDMRAVGNGVLLLSRDSRASAPDFVEVVFK